MLNFIENQLSSFKSCFSRSAAYRWFVVVIVGLLARTDFLGVTSIIRCLAISPSRYESLLHFFRSDAFSIQDLRQTWLRLVSKSGTLFTFNSRTLLLGDGTKHPKEGRYMPGVKKLFQESGDSSKPSYLFGHMFGGIAAVLHRGGCFFALPLTMSIQDGLSETAAWSKSCASRALSHIIQMVRNGYGAAASLGLSYLVLDRYFLSVPALEELDRLNQHCHLLDTITRAKSSCTAYELPENTARRRGRPRKKGTPVKLNTLFQDRASDFTRAQVLMYGKRETVEYLCLDLLWGKKLYKKLRFVLVKSRKGNCIFVSTDLALEPAEIIEAYAHRFKIECTFREFKQHIGGFCYHFWTKAMPKIKKYGKKEEASGLSDVEDCRRRNRILKTVEDTERFVLCASIAMGITQMMALTPSIAETVRKHRYLRTASGHKVSEATVLEYLRKNIFRLLYLNRHSEISQLILSLQVPESSAGGEQMPA